MKKYTHAWLAMMAMKRIEKAAITERQKDDAKALVKWFKDYRDFVISGAWYPDEVIKDMGTSHIVKYVNNPDSKDTSFRAMPATLRLFQEGKDDPRKAIPFTIKGGNLCDRCEALTESIIDSFKILDSESAGSPITPSANHIALRFFILSHYIADCHMPLHCDGRSFYDENQVHGFIEAEWDKQVAQSYYIDDDNERFFYDPEGYPLPKEKTPLVEYVEKELVSRKFIWEWYGKDWDYSCKNTWDYMSGISQYSYLMAYKLIPEFDEPKKISTARYIETQAYKEHFEEYSKIILADAVESIAKVWLHAWVRYRDWARGCEVAALAQDVRDLKKALKEANDSIAKLPSKIETLQTRLDKYWTTLETKKATLEKAKASNKDTTKAEAAVVSAQESYDKVKVQLESAVSDYNDAVEKAPALQTLVQAAEIKHDGTEKLYKKYEDKNSGI